MWGERGGMGEEKVWRGLGHLWQLKVPRIHKLGKLSNVGEHLDRITVGSATPHKPHSPACNTSSHHPPTMNLCSSRLCNILVLSSRPEACLGDRGDR